MSTRKKLLALTLLAALAAAAGSFTYSAFIAKSTNSGDSIASGTVTLTDNDTGTALLTLAAAQPAATDTGCIKLTYGGSLASTVRLYGTTTGTGLDQYIDLKITRGVYTPTDPGFDSCTNFQADATDYIGAGAGVVYNGTLQAFPDTYATGLVDPTSGPPESWATAEEHIYKIEVTLQSNFAAQGLNATQTFTWEARNL